MVGQAVLAGVGSKTILSIWGHPIEQDQMPEKTFSEQTWGCTHPPYSSLEISDPDPLVQESDPSVMWFRFGGMQIEQIWH